MDTRENIYDFIVDYKTKHQGNTPTRREIQKGCGISSTCVVQFHIEKLTSANRITRTGRNIEIPGAVWMIPNQREGEHG